jgi:hypothetical protein
LSVPNEKKIIHDVRRELVAKAFEIAVCYWEAIDLTATAMLLEARKNSGIVGKRFETINQLACCALDQSNSPSGYHRDLSLPVSHDASAYAAEKRTLHSRILLLKKIISVGRFSILLMVELHFAHCLKY